MNTRNKNKHRWLLRLMAIPVVLAIMLSGCGGGGGGGTPDADNNGDGGKTADVGNSIDCSGDNPDKRCGEDDDNDGLPYAMEVAGWEVWPDRSGLGNGVEQASHYTVSSDPDKADTDGDGLNDYQEFLNKTDPRMVDTDGDGLSDAEELNRWHTSPVSVDSDGDSRGPDKDLSPNSKLFDSAELKIDLKGDPTHTPGIDATSPVLADTDGDGWSDYTEIVNLIGKGFNPVIADVPLIKIGISTSPVIRLTGETSTQQNWSREIAVSDAISESVSSESSVTRGTEQVIESTVGAGADFGIETGFEVSKDPKWTGKVSANFSTNFSLSASMTSSQSVSWSEGQSRVAEKTYQESMGEGGSEAVTLTGGYLSLPVNLTNTGNISFTITGLHINVLARYMNGTSDFAPVLELKQVDDQPLTLGPNQTYPQILMKSDTDDYELIRSFLKNPGGLLFEVSSYTLTDDKGVSYAFAEETIKQKTAMVIIDYGGELPPESYLVATSPQRSSEQQGSGVSMATVMNNILGLPYNTFARTTDLGTFMTLSQVRSVTNDPQHHKKWLVTTTSASLDNPDLAGFDDISLQPGDTIYFMFVKDEDSDGLAAREEFLQGTSDQLADTDNDGLTDYQEVREGWSVKIEGQLAYDVHSRGYNADFDGDGLTDDFERSCGLDPNRSDTDQDGISDYDELYGYDIIKNGQLFLKVVPYTGAVILDGGNGIIDTQTPAGDDVLPATGSIEKGAIIIIAGEDGVLDTTPQGDDYIGVTHEALPCEPAGFATNPLNIDTDGESMPDGMEVDIALGSPNNPNDVAQYTDTDGDGLSDAVEKRGFSTTVNGLYKKFTSDPNSGDSDNDGLPDLLEYMLKSNPGADDTDGDGLADLDEYDFLTQWNEFTLKCGQAANCTVPASEGDKYGTAINNQDTDGDGLGDGIEISGWLVTVDDGQPKRVKPKSALIKEDSDHDGLYDYDEYIHKTDPQDFDTDKDGTSDGKELTIYSSFSKHSRNPTQKDRKITLAYKSLVYAGKCDFGIVWWDKWNDLEWILGVRTPLAPTFMALAFSKNEPEDKLGVGPKGVLDNHTETFTAANSINFIARYGAKFEFYGYAKELDSAGGWLKYWNLTDGGMMYHDRECVDCEQLFIKDTNDSALVKAVSEQLRFTVG
ncbi:hypothetical protein MNBD_GAMMA24-2209, partial [hydrothermal vent metagenome]